ncbi:hypothetical protein [Amnibacterium kyonggiense]|uniref:Protein kinase domain-containing protein n=1 Tax=Amnibacterium kyonggiense TaxID=595671 RepID=A0A4R7FME1_9MICO|nr:hypothetical protein [Amnibacterium kyonggiense]TDS77489.1 hypothetical protein CLV52_2435 [Amnibacterium kyonggiense]
MHEDGTGFEDEPTLAEALRDGPLTLDDAIRTASAVADAVAALHAAGRAHGGFGPEDVALGSRVALIGPDAPKAGLAAPPALRARDLQGVGRVLAAALGGPEHDLPAPIVELLRRAEASDAPAAALADALHRLRRDPTAAAELLQPRPEPAPARRPLAAVVPRPDRRTTGVAAVAVVGAAVVGAVLLLVGAPASTVRAPVAAAAVEPSTATVAPEADEPAVAAALPTSTPAALRPRPTRTAAPTTVQRSQTGRAATSPDPAAAPAAVRPARVAPSTPAPSPTARPTSRPAPSATTPATADPSAPASPAPTAPPAPTAQPTAAPSPAPAASTSAPRSSAASTTPSR